MLVSLGEPGIADAEFQNILAVSVTGIKAMSTMGVIEHASSCTNVTIPVTNWDEYLSGWDHSNSVLQLVIEKFLVIECVIGNWLNIGMLLSSYHQFSGIITINRSDVHAKVQDQRSKIKVTEVKTI